MYNKVSMGKPAGRRPLEDLGIDDRITLKRILRKSVERALTGLIAFRTEIRLASFCECNNETSGPTMCWEFLD
jgi:hypothetical protein